ncbi:uncharacterized protein LOC134229349 [Saccostrea cucullata]|uniref:uncharacterized protein LOC134229349 n=1 Tax=Saccostrea cuccullata TaxID=36930 RepID=UPI002ED0D120
MPIEQSGKNEKPGCSVLYLKQPRQPGTHCFCRENEKTELGSVTNKTCKLQNSENFLKDLVGPKYDAGQAGDYNGIAMYRKMNDVTYIEDSLVECLRETEEGNETYPCDAPDSMGYTWTESLKRQGIDYNKLPRWTPYIRRLIISERKGTSTPRTTISGHGTSKGHQITDSSPVDRHNDSNEQSDSKLPLIIGSVVGGFLSVVIVVMIIVIVIKRRRPNKKENSHPAPTENVYYSEMKEDKKSQLTMEKEEPSPTVDSTDYDTMMSVNKEKITDDSEEYGKLLPNDDADVYNHTWDKPITEQFTDHVYSSTFSGNDANEYDHTVTSYTELTKDTEEKRTLLNGNEDNLYDHTDTNNTELSKVSDENR